MGTTWSSGSRRTDDAVPDDASGVTAVPSAGLKDKPDENDGENNANDQDDNSDHKNNQDDDDYNALHPCGCHKNYPPRIPSLPFNDTPENRELCKTLRNTGRSRTALFNVSNGEDHAGHLDITDKDNLWIKVGNRQCLAEASTMRWVAAHTDIPVPRVICAIEDKTWEKESQQVVVLMEGVRGRLLGRKWKAGMSRESKDRVLAQFKTMVDQMRAIPCPPARRYESVDGGPLYGPPLVHSFPEIFYRSTYGPCPSFHTLQHQLYQEFLVKHGANWTEHSPDIPRHSAGWQRLNPTAGAPRYSDEAACPPPVFSHGALTPFVIFVDDDDTVTGIIQWSTAGWWPDYWEYSQAISFWNGGYVKGWEKERSSFLSPFQSEYKVEWKRRSMHAGVGTTCCSCSDEESD